MHTFRLPFLLLFISLTCVAGGKKSPIAGTPFTPLDPNDPRVTQEFSDLGPMYEVNGVIWSGFSSERLSLADAYSFCAKLGSVGEWKPSLPSLGDWLKLAKKMGKSGDMFESYDGYNPEIFPGIANKVGWSSSASDEDGNAAFHGGLGKVVFIKKKTRKLDTVCVLFKTGR